MKKVIALFVFNTAAAALNVYLARYYWAEGSALAYGYIAGIVLLAIAAGINVDTIHIILDTNRIKRDIEEMRR